MKNLIEYIYEVSRETSLSALKKAENELEELQVKFRESNFKDNDILSKLQKKVKQIETFTKYIENLNDETIDLASGKLKELIKKWDKGVKLDNEILFKPLIKVYNNYINVTFLKIDKNEERLRKAGLNKFSNKEEANKAIENAKIKDEEAKKIIRELVQDFLSIPGIDKHDCEIIALPVKYYSAEFNFDEQLRKYFNYEVGKQFDKK